ncbi:MAG: hypothetical protein U0R44_00980 [Candidatus Micrarchaeia archaeon]
MRQTKTVPEGALRRVRAFENQQPVSEPPQTVREILSVFHRGYESGVYASGSNLFFEWGLGRIKEMNYSRDDVREFSRQLGRFRHEADFGYRAQRVLNALISHGREDDYILDIGPAGALINSLGYYNTRRVTINGDAGDTLAFEMNGGVLTLNGDAGKMVAAKMSGGVVILNGSYESIGGFHGGQVFHGGEQIRQ